MELMAIVLKSRKASATGCKEARKMPKVVAVLIQTTLVTTGMVMLSTSKDSGGDFNKDFVNTEMIVDGNQLSAHPKKKAY